MKEWILPTVGTFICWGLWSFIPKITTKYIDPKSAVVYEVIGGIVLSIFVLGFMNFRLETHPKGIALAGLAGLVGFVGALCFLFTVCPEQNQYPKIHVFVGHRRDIVELAPELDHSKSSTVFTGKVLRELLICMGS